MLLLASTSMLNLKRLTDNHASRTVQFFVGLRKAWSSVTPAEHALLANLARNKTCIIEVGVYEGVTSQTFCRAMDPRGRLYLVDPYYPETRIEKLLNVAEGPCGASAAWPERSRIDKTGRSGGRRPSRHLPPAGHGRRRLRQ